MIVVNMPKPIHKFRHNAETLESMLSKRFSLVRLYSSNEETRSWVVAIASSSISSQSGCVDNSHIALISVVISNESEKSKARN